MVKEERSYLLLLCQKKRMIVFGPLLPYEYEMNQKKKKKEWWLILPSGLKGGKKAADGCWD